MGRKLCPKIILEGTRLTKKTDVAFALNEHPQIVGPKKYRYHSPLISAEWCAFTNVPWGRGLINFAPEEEAQALETYRTWVRLFELQKYYSWIVDRFHLSTQVYQWMERKKKYEFGWLEDRLLPLGFHVVFLTRPPESFAAARLERLPVSGNPGQYDDCDKFVREQEHFREAIGRSLLPWKEFDCSQLTANGIADQIADWLSETGGLYVRE
jgi:hypothetical protein